jgi:hypothetical protein
MKIIRQSPVAALQTATRRCSSQKSNPSQKVWASVMAVAAGGIAYASYQWLESNSLRRAEPLAASSISSTSPAARLSSWVDSKRRVEPSEPILSSIWVRRRKELAAVEVGLADRSQPTAICLLSGVHGIGKTQLALRVMEKYTAWCPDRVRYMDISQAPVDLGTGQCAEELLIIDNISSSTQLEEALQVLKMAKPKRALLVGCYSPVHLPYFKTHMTHIELPGLSKRDLQNLCEEIRHFPEYEGFTLEGIEHIRDPRGNYHPGLFLSAAIRCSDMGFTNIGRLFETCPKEAFIKHRLEYSPLSDRYQRLFKELSTEEQRVVCNIAQGHLPHTSWTLDTLGLHGDTGVHTAADLVGKMVLDFTFNEEGDLRYSSRDTAFLRYVRDMELTSKRTLTLQELSMIAAVCLTTWGTVWALRR